MTTNNDDFWNWINTHYPDYPPPLSKIWQAAKADSEREIKEIKAKHAQLQLDNNRLREALEENHYSNSSDKAIKLYNDAMYSTPAESLAEHDNEVLERAAKEFDNHDDEAWIARKIRALKEVK